MKTNNVPAIVMLVAGFIDCVIGIRMKQPLLPFTRQLLIVLLIFYILGAVIKVILDRNFNDMKDLEEVDLGEEVHAAQAENKEEPEEMQEAEEPEDAQN